MRNLFLFLFIVFSSFALARVEIAFIPMRTADGSIVQFEQGGRFAHVAVSFQGLWFHAHPRRGVELSRNLKDFGNEIVVLTSDEYNEPTEAFVRSQLGKPFSYLKPWEDETYQYCSKLIAQAFGIPPTPMSFSGQSWKNRRDVPRGALGASADKLYRAFLAMGFRVKSKSCASHLLPTADQVALVDAKRFHGKEGATPH